MCAQIMAIHACVCDCTAYTFIYSYVYVCIDKCGYVHVSAYAHV